MVRFGNLHKLQLFWYLHNYKLPFSLFENFDFLATPIEVVIPVCIGPFGRLDFPNVKKFSLGAPQRVVDHISLSAFNHLTISLSYDQEHLWSKLCEAKQIPIDMITSLQLNVSHLTCEMPELQTEPFRSFNEVISLIVTHQMDSVTNRWPTC
jgi:hypothetical protein